MTYLLAILIGLSLGMLGSGGSILAVPILKYSAGLSAKQAVATSLATVGSVSFVGALLAWKEKSVAWTEAALFSFVATLGTFGGVKIAGFLSDKIQMGLFIVVMVYAVFRMLGQKTKFDPPKQGRTAAVFKALGVGLLTGIVGVGGGFLIVPALVALFGLPMKRATGTSLVVITTNSFVGAWTYAGQVDIDWQFTAAFSSAAVLGLVAGMIWTRSVSDEKLKKLFAVVVALVCAYTIIQELII